MYTKLLPIFLLVALTISCKEASIIGKWRRVDKSQYKPDSTDRNGNVWGDLILKRDSTYFMKAYGSSGDTSHAPGWHMVVNDIYGNWRSKNDRNLVLYQFISGRDFGMWFTISTLTKRKLSLVFSMDKKRLFQEKKHLRYIRLK